MAHILARRIKFKCIYARPLINLPRRVENFGWMMASRNATRATAGLYIQSRTILRKSGWRSFRTPVAVASLTRPAQARGQSHLRLTGKPIPFRLLLDRHCDFLLHHLQDFLSKAPIVYLSPKVPHLLVSAIHPHLSRLQPLQHVSRCLGKGRPYSRRGV